MQIAPWDEDSILDRGLGMFDVALESDLAWARRAADLLANHGAIRSRPPNDARTIVGPPLPGCGGIFCLMEREHRTTAESPSNCGLGANTAGFVSVN
jgi:hypothetical protein